MAGMRDIEKRLEKLEQIYSPTEITVIMLTNWGAGEIKGWKGDGIYIARNSGESEEALAERAATAAQAHHNAHPSLSPGYILLQMNREHVPYFKLEPRPESLPETSPAPKAQPEPSDRGCLALDGLRHTFSLAGQDRTGKPCGVCSDNS